LDRQRPTSTVALTLTLTSTSTSTFPASPPPLPNLRALISSLTLFTSSYITPTPTHALTSTRKHDAHCTPSAEHAPPNQEAVDRPAHPRGGETSRDHPAAGRAGPRVRGGRMRSRDGERDRDRDRVPRGRSRQLPAAQPVGRVPERDRSQQPNTHQRHNSPRERNRRSRRRHRRFNALVWSCRIFGLEPGFDAYTLVRTSLPTTDLRATNLPARRLGRCRYLRFALCRGFTLCQGFGSHLAHSLSATIHCSCGPHHTGDLRLSPKPPPHLRRHRHIARRHHTSRLRLDPSLTLRLSPSPRLSFGVSPTLCRRLPFPLAARGLPPSRIRRSLLFLSRLLIHRRAITDHLRRQRWEHERRFKRRGPQHSNFHFNPADALAVLLTIAKSGSRVGHRRAPNAALKLELKVKARTRLSPSIRTLPRLQPFPTHISCCRCDCSRHSRRISRRLSRVPLPHPGRPIRPAHQSSHLVNAEHRHASRPGPRHPRVLRPHRLVHDDMRHPVREPLRDLGPGGGSQLPHRVHGGPGTEHQQPQSLARTLRRDTGDLRPRLPACLIRRGESRHTRQPRPALTSTSAPKPQHAAHLTRSAQKKPRRRANP
jgi:hypothetical protein